MKDILHKIITSIVSKDEAVEITEEEEQGVVNLTIQVDPEDMGKIIGKEGKVIRAIRNVMRIPAINEGKKIYINIKEV